MNATLETRMKPAVDTRTIQDISNWLIDQGLASAGFEAILSGFCERLIDAGLKLDRGVMAMRTLHPSVDAETFTWRRGAGIDSARFELDQREEAGWRDSPMYHMISTGNPVLRRRLAGDGANPDFPILKELAAEGYTDYFARIIPFEIGAAKPKENGLISTWTTAAPEGFAEVDIAVLDRLLPRLALTAKATLTLEIAENVLDTYVGPEAGRRIMQGDIRRGALDSIRAVLLYADLRGYTRITDTVPRETLAPMLDAYFDEMVPAVTRHGGQVLKYLGDGLLATFNLDDLPRDAVCSTALQAGVEALELVAELNARRAAAGEPVMQLDIAMHLGDVLYGNVGAADRQDFTVIGPAVNEASRIELLCEELDHNLLISETFASVATACAHRLVPLGRHALRGVREPQELYTVDLLSGG